MDIVRRPRNCLSKGKFLENMKTWSHQSVVFVVSDRRCLHWKKAWGVLCSGQLTRTTFAVPATTFPIHWLTHRRMLLMTTLKRHTRNKSGECVRSGGGKGKKKGRKQLPYHRWAGGLSVWFKCFSCWLLSRRCNLLNCSHKPIFLEVTFFDGN